MAFLTTPPLPACAASFSLVWASFRLERSKLSSYLCVSSLFRFRPPWLVTKRQYIRLDIFIFLFYFPCSKGVGILCKASISFFVIRVVLSFFLINNTILTNKMKRVRLTMIEWVMTSRHGRSRARPSCAHPWYVTSRAMLYPSWKMLSLAWAKGMS